MIFHYLRSCSLIKKSKKEKTKKNLNQMKSSFHWIEILFFWNMIKWILFLFLSLYLVFPLSSFTRLIFSLSVLNWSIWTFNNCLCYLWNLLFFYFCLSFSFFIFLNCWVLIFWNWSVCRRGFLVLCSSHGIQAATNNMELPVVYGHWSISIFSRNGKYKICFNN